MNNIALAGVLLTLLWQPVISGSQVLNTIDAQQLMTWMASPDPPQMLDVRGRQAYRTGTLPGAFNAGLDPLGYLPDHNEDPVVLLAPEDIDSGQLAAWQSRLHNMGHPVWLLMGGMAAWIAAGGSIEQPNTHYTKPGRVPFLIPRGLCEGGEPAQVFE